MKKTVKAANKSAEAKQARTTAVDAPPARGPFSAKFDVDMVNWYRGHGKGYQAKMNDVLRKYMAATQKRQARQPASNPNSQGRHNRQVNE